MRPNAHLPHALSLLLALAAGSAAAQRTLWSSPAGAEQVPENPVAAAWSVELADDFDAWGEVASLAISGADCPDCPVAAVAAVEVRFWSWRGVGGPGPLEAEYRVKVGDDHLQVDPDRPAKLGIRLATPFAARGRHFVSVRVEFAGTGVWAWLRGAEPERLEPAWERDDAGLWAPAGSPRAGGGDLAFELASSAWDDVDRARGCGRFELEAPAPPAGIYAWRLADVAALDAERAFAVGTGKSDEGERPVVLERRQGVWTPMAPPLPPGARLEAVEALPSGAIWFAGSALRAAGPAPEVRQPLLLAWHPKGGRWEQLDVPAVTEGEGELFDLAAHGAQEVWLVGAARESAGGALRRSALLLRWTGAGFERFRLAAAPDGVDEGLTAAASDGDALWAVGGGGASPLEASPLVARWNGREWERVAALGLDRAGALDSVAARPGELWIGGVTQALDPLLVGFDGSAWRSHASPTGGRALALPERGDALTAGQGLASFRAGEWRAEPGAEGLDLVALTRPSACSAFVAGSQLAQGGERGVVLRLVHAGFGDDFESGGFEAWSAAIVPVPAQ